MIKREYVPRFLAFLLSVLTHLTSEQRRIRRLASSEDEQDVSDGSDDDHDNDDNDQPNAKRSRLSRGSRPTKARSTESPAPGTSKLKRKQSVVEGDPPAKKSKPSGPNDDQTRKYCLGKLQEIFSNIFLDFPCFPPEASVKTRGQDANDSESNAVLPVLDGGFTKTTAELTEEEMAYLKEKADAYATQVEAAIFEAHAEFDKAGSPSASGKYK